MATQRFTLSSPAFLAEDEIPALYSCRGQNISPPLSIEGTPEGTQSFVLIMHDPDAPIGDFLHWSVWDIPALVMSIIENQVPAQAKQGMNGAGRVGYFGPCPPSGTHRYVFELYALDTVLGLPSGSDRSSLERLIPGHTIAKAELEGLFTRQVTE